MKVYLDVCCLCRPFDDQDDLRVASEGAAIDSIFEAIDAGQLVDFSSEMAQIEIARIKDGERRRSVTRLLPPTSRILPLDMLLLDDAQRLVDRGFGLADAVHLGAAIRQGVDVFLSVDEKLLKRARKHLVASRLRLMNPVFFVEELR